MARLRRAKLEVVVPVERAARYRGQCGGTGPRDAGDLGRGHSAGPVLPARRHPAASLPVPSTRRTPSFASWCARRWRRRSQSRSPDEDPNPWRHPGAEGGRSGDRQRAFPGRGLPLPRRGAVCRVSSVRREAAAAEHAADASAPRMVRRLAGAEPRCASACGGACPIRMALAGVSAEPCERRRRERRVAVACAGDLSAAGCGALPVWRGQQSACRRTGETVALAGVLRRGSAADAFSTIGWCRAIRSPDRSSRRWRALPVGGEALDPLAGAGCWQRGCTTRCIGACARCGRWRRRGRGRRRPWLEGGGEAAAGCGAVSAAPAGPLLVGRRDAGGRRDADDEWLALARAVAATGAWPRH